MTKKEKKVLMQKMSGAPVKKTRARRPRKRANRNTNPVIPSSRNGAGRKRGQRRQRGGKETTTFGNTRNFTIPIDEDIGTIIGSVAYALDTFSINPGNPALFPFASRIAQNYERYEFLDLRFEYRPSASVFATVGAQGLVGISATMDAVQAPPSNQAQADVLYHGPIVETARPTSLKLPITFMQCKNLREKFFVRQQGIVPGGADPHTYDCGQVFFWTNGQANTNAIGTIRVLGSCRLSNPASELSNVPPPNFKVALFSSANQVTAPTGTAFSAPFINVQTNPVGITQDVTLSIFTLPVGNWLVDYVGDIDLTGQRTTTGLISTCNIMINGANTGPFITSTCPGPIATNTLDQHVQTSYSWFVQSNGATTVAFRHVLTYGAGAPDIDCIARFVAV